MNKYFMKIQTAIFTIITFSILSTSLWATTFYVDATNGQDYNNGLTTSTAWKTLSKVNNSKFLPGDRILFRRGQTWRSELIIPSNGSYGNHITFAAYGDGANPIISGGKVITGWTGENSNYYAPLPVESHRVIQDKKWLNKVTAKNQLVAGSWWYDNASKRLYIRTINNDHPGNHLIEGSQRDKVIYMNFKSFITLENITAELANGDRSGIHIHNSGSNWIIRNCVSRYNWRPGLSLNGHSGNVALIVKDSKFYFNGSAGINVISENPTSPLTGITIEGNEAYENTLSWYYETGVEDGNGIKIFYVNNSMIRNNITYNNRRAGIGLDGSRAQVSGCDGNTIENNISYKNGGSGIQLEAGSDNNIVRYNYCYDNGTKFWSSGINVLGKAHNNKIFYNIVKNHGVGGGLYQVIEGSQGTIFYNNVAVGAISGWWINDDDAPVAVNSILKNNIYYGTGTAYGLNVVSSNYSGFKSDYNIWYGSSGVNYNRNFQSLAQYRSSTNNADHSFAANPLFKNIVNNDFSLQASSPAIDAGTSVGLSNDFEGVSVPQGAQVDIGAFEYQGQTGGGGGGASNITVPKNLRIVLGN